MAVDVFWSPAFLFRIDFSCTGLSSIDIIVINSFPIFSLYFPLADTSGRSEDYIDLVSGDAPLRIDASPADKIYVPLFLRRFDEVRGCRSIACCGVSIKIWIAMSYHTELWGCRDSEYFNKNIPKSTTFLSLKINRAIVTLVLEDGILFEARYVYGFYEHGKPWQFLYFILPLQMV